MAALRRLTSADIYQTCWDFAVSTIMGALGFLKTSLGHSPWARWVHLAFENLVGDFCREHDGCI